MIRFTVTAIFVFCLASQPTYGQIITDKSKCLSQLKTVEEMNEEADIGSKLEPIVADLINVLRGYCESNNFKNADEVAHAIRGLLATEHSEG